LGKSSISTIELPYRFSVFFAFLWFTFHEPKAKGIDMPLALHVITAALEVTAGYKLLAFVRAEFLAYLTSHFGFHATFLSLLLSSTGGRAKGVVTHFVRRSMYVLRSG